MASEQMTPQAGDVVSVDGRDRFMVRKIEGDVAVLAAGRTDRGFRVELSRVAVLYRDTR